MDDRSALVEQFKSYQHENKNLLNENGKLFAKCKRLKMEKKQLKLQLQTQMQNNSSTERYIENKTLQFVYHHHIEMQKMLDNLLSHPTIIKSSTHKDLEYLSSKLSYIQSKIALITNGKTATTSPPNLHSQRNSHYPPSSKSITTCSDTEKSEESKQTIGQSPYINNKNNNNNNKNHIHSPRSMITTETESDASYNINIHTKHKHNKARQLHHAQHPNPHNLSSRSSPHKSSRKKKMNGMSHGNMSYDDNYNMNMTSNHSSYFDHDGYHSHITHRGGNKIQKQRHSNPDRTDSITSSNKNDQSLQQQLKQLDLEKYLNSVERQSDKSTKTMIIHNNHSSQIRPTSISSNSMTSNSETDDMPPLRSHNLPLPIDRKRRSTQISTLSMQASRATSIIEECIDDLAEHATDVDIPPLPPSPIPDDIPNHHKKQHHPHHHHHKMAKLPHHVPYITSAHNGQNQPISEHHGTPTSTQEMHDNIYYSSSYTSPKYTPFKLSKINKSRRKSSDMVIMDNNNNNINNIHPHSHHHQHKNNENNANNSHFLSPQTRQHPKIRRSKSRNLMFDERINAQKPMNRNRHSHNDHTHHHDAMKYSHNSSVSKHINHHHISSRSVAINGNKHKPSKSRQLDVEHISMKLQHHVIKEKLSSSLPRPQQISHPPLRCNPRNGTPTPPPPHPNNHIQQRKSRQITPTPDSADCSGSDIKCNLKMVHESPDSQQSHSQIDGSSSASGSIYSPSAHSLLKRYNARKQQRKCSEKTESLSNVNFDYDFQSELEKRDSIQSYNTLSTTTTNDRDNKQIQKSKHIKSKTYDINYNENNDGLKNLFRKHREEISHQHIHVKGSSKMAQFNLQIDVSEVNNPQKLNENMKRKRRESKHTKNESSPLSSRTTPAIPEDEEKIAGKWKVHRAVSPGPPDQSKKIKSKRIKKSKSKTLSQSINIQPILKKKKIDKNRMLFTSSSDSISSSSSSSCSSSSTSSSDGDTNSTDNSSSSSDNEHKDNSDDESDGESDEYYESETEIEYSQHIEGNGHRKQQHDNKRYKIGISRAISLEKKKSNKSIISSHDSEGVGGHNDDFFDSTSTHSPFTLSNNEKNVFTPSAISPYGFFSKSKRSKTVSAIDMYSKGRKRKKKINDRKKEIKQQEKIKKHSNGIRKHNSVTHIDEIEMEEKYPSNRLQIDIEQIKQEMLNEYKENKNDHRNQRRNSIELIDNKQNEEDEAKTSVESQEEEEKKEPAMNLIRCLSPKSPNNYLSPTGFASMSDSDNCIVPRVRRLSIKEKQKLLVIDDLIATILEDKNSYLMTKALLLSYRAFTTSILLMKVLRRRFRVPHDYVDRVRMKENKNNNNNKHKDDDESKVVEFNEKEVAYKIQLGISQLIYAWMHQYWDDDFMSHPMLQKEIYEFQSDIDKFIVDKNKSNIIRKLLAEPNNALFSKPNFSNHSVSRSQPSSIISNSSSSRSRSASRLEDVNEEIRTRWPHLMGSHNGLNIPKQFLILNYKFEDIAKQIILMDYYVFKEIRPRECIAQAWKKKDKWERASNLLRMINQFNSVCRWCQLAILNYGKSPKDKSKMIKHMICLAKSLYDYQDFSALCAVHGALVSTPIKRLNKAWKKINKKYIKMIEKISTLFQWNSPKLVELHETCKGPVIPHLGIILKNVISIEESDEYKPDGTINRHKMHLLAQQVEKLMKWQEKSTYVYSQNKKERKINKNNKQFIINQDLILQKLIFRDFLQQINITDDDIFNMIENKK